MITAPNPTRAPAAPKTVPELLRHAALVIEERGWCRRLAMDDEGRVCAVGAVHVANGNAHLLPARVKGYDHAALWDERAEAVQTWLTDYLGATPALWNDAPETHADDVTAMLRRAATAYEAAHR